MKKLGFPLFLFRTILVPKLTFDLADKRGAITNSSQKNLLITYLKENSLHLDNSSKYLFFKEYKSSFFRCNFYKEIHQNEEWYNYSLGKLSNGKHHTFPKVLEC